MLNATLKIRGISESAFEAILEMLGEEAKDVRVESWPSGDGPDFDPRGVTPVLAAKPSQRTARSDVRDPYGWPDPRRR